MSEEGRVMKRQLVLQHKGWVLTGRAANRNPRVGPVFNDGTTGVVMSLRWKRVNHWKNIRALVSSVDDPNKVYALIQRGRRPNEYNIVFPANAHVWSIKYHLMERKRTTNPIPDFVLQESSLATAKAVGMLIVKTQGEV